MRPPPVAVCVWKFYKTWPVHVNCRMVMNVNDMRLGSVSYTVKT